MNYNKLIIIVPGQPESIFFEIFFKSLNKLKINNPILLVGSQKLIKNQMKKFNFKKKVKLIDKNNLKKSKLNNKYINLINVDYHTEKNLKKNLSNTTSYVYECFETAFKIIKKYKIKKFINGPINKQKILKGKYLGITEYISNNFKIKKQAMLIYNDQLSVCPVTTHEALKNVNKKITKKIIYEKVKLINDFFVNNFNKKPKVAILGINPHCESVEKFNKDEKIVKPSVNFLKKKGYRVTGPLSADTIFLKQNRSKYNVIVGMYHDQVLAPIKTLFEYDAINITLGLPFFRISPDHGPNEHMIGKNKSNPLSLMRAISFLDKI